MPRSIAFATYADRPEGEPSDVHAAAVLAARGIEVAFVPWTDEAVDWSSFDAVVVRSTWDYYHHVDAFLEWAARVDTQTQLFNPLPILRGNVDKSYLHTMEAAGISLVPTAWPHAGDRLADVLAAREWDEAVVKPAVSAGAFETFRVGRGDAEAAQARFDALLARGAVLVQPFLSTIATEGEWSLMFFDGRYSHAVVKRPKAGDFRVQPRHGGRETHVDAPEALVRQARAVLHVLPERSLYARVDGIVEAGTLLLMELEVVEPALFLQHKGAAERFADALAARLD